MTLFQITTYELFRILNRMLDLLGPNKGVYEKRGLTGIYGLENFVWLRANMATALINRKVLKMPITNPILYIRELIPAGNVRQLSAADVAEFVGIPSNP